MPLSTPLRLATLLLAVGLLAPAAAAQDLAVPSVSSEDPSGDPGDRVSLEFTIANFGNQDADEFLVGFFFSTDRTFSSDDVFAEDEDGGDIDAGDEEDEDEQITVPSGLEPGNYFILVVADYTDVIAETNETNNTGSVSFRVTGQGGSGSVDGEIESTSGDVPASGGTVTYTVTLTNNTSQSQTITAEVNVTLPDGSQFGPIMGPRTVTLGSGLTVTRTFTEQVPAGAPTGTYRVRLTARANGSLVVSDTFTFEKGDGNDLVAGTMAARAAVEGAYPNPFREQTAIRFHLEDATDVRLAVYDLLGREVAVLTDGPMQPGMHESLFDGQGLSSGVYVWHLRAGDQVQSGRVNLVR